MYRKKPTKKKKPWAQGAAACNGKACDFKGPVSRAILGTKNRTISAATTMVLHSLAAVLLWLNVVVVAAVVVFVVGVQDRNCWLALLAVGVWFIVNFMLRLPTKRSQMGTTSGMFLAGPGCFFG